MQDESIKRFNRLIALLTSLQTKRIIKAQDLAERFGVSLRTIYRDIRALEQAGVPILSEAGVGYSLMDGYRIPPVMFTREEAGSLVTAEKLMRSLSDKSLGNQFTSAVEKIRSVLKTYDKEWLDSLDETIQVRVPKVMFNEEIEDSLQVVIHSIADRKSIIMKYKTFYGEESEREIEPVGIFHENNNWYILGFCLLRNDYRQFRTDRIIKINRTQNRFHRQHPSLSYFLKENTDIPRVKVRLLVDPKIANYLSSSRHNYGYVSERMSEKGIEMTFETIEISEAFPRWFLCFGDHMQILEPEELKENVRKLISKISV
ncbi:helix-turn-helix transcriptional regulator [Leadbetterella byssophila]|uniref:Regulatory protein DeoR n=1 Tax=Leadbetterella byssophila (strain DSM 17132 / JCM 16389 / KACC 11308 / NBRC 106382 / 4M15) TaxID=649349 RepID=E4RRT3_LEAB4|nr:YafY family protein [Leadbetterella byssophila]ADQ17620.1 regulatory protein DeoR [Leadbetterella byssophila DSM 17132]